MPKIGMKTMDEREINPYSIEPEHKRFLQKKLLLCSRLLSVLMTRIFLRIFQLKNRKIFKQQLEIAVN